MQKKYEEEGVFCVFVFRLGYRDLSCEMGGEKMTRKKSKLCLLTLSALSLSFFQSNVFAEENMDSAKYQIAEFEELTEENGYIYLLDEKLPRPEELKKIMPDSLRAVTEENEEINIPVEWYCDEEEYYDDTAYTIVFEPEFDTEVYHVEEDCELPLFYVDVKAREEYKPSTFNLTGKGNEDTCYNFLRNSVGLNCASSCGVLGNLYIECSFNPLAYNSKENAWGICQWRGSRLSQLQSRYPNSWKTIGSQLNFLVDEFNGVDYSGPKTLSYLRGRADNSNGAQEAAQYFAQYFERCAASTYASRKSWAVKFYNDRKVAHDPFGYLDSCSGGEGVVNISGWARDDDAPDEGIEIHVYIGGPAGSAETEGHSGIYANKYRSDVGNHAYSETIKTNKTGRQEIYIYGINIGGGSNALIATGTVTITPNEPPQISDVRVENLSSGGYTVRCNVSDNSGISSVKFPTWTANGDQNGQDDLVWHVGTVSGNTAECTINVKDHNNETNCIYITHIYAYDTSGNTAWANAGEIYVDSTSPVISNVKVTNVGAEGFDISCKVTDNHSIDRVKFPTWTRLNGQDDLVKDWSTNEICSGKTDGNIVSYHVNTSDHNGEKGIYYVHIYAFDECGNRNPWTMAVYVGDDKYETEPLLTEVYKGHVYMLFEGTNCDGNAQLSWSEAASYCQSIGGILACITSEEENKVVASMVNRYGVPCWIGGNDVEQEGNFVWESGEAFSYSNWDAGEPNNKGNQDFIRMYTNGLWDDCEQDSHYAFICEFDNMISTITYHLDGGINNTDNPDYYYADNPYVKLSDPSKEGYIFEGWYLSETGGEAVTEKTKLQGDIDLYARWKKDYVPTLSVTQENEKLIASISNTESVTGYGFVYGKQGNVTLETPGRTRIAYLKLDADGCYSLDTEELSGCTVRAYVTYTNENGKEQAVYSRE